MGYRDNIIKEREHIHIMEYSWEFGNPEDPISNGYSFPCDKFGNVLEMEDCAWENLIKCIQQDGKYYDRILDKGILRRERWYWEPAVLKCHCGREVQLESFTNTCECGSDYNTSGQQLAPRSQWGEETGETADDILNYDYDRCPEVDY